MKRLSGYYRRSIRIVMIGLAIIVAVVCNVDAVSLARDLWRNPEGRAALVAQADTLTAPPTTPTSGTPPTSAPGNADIAAIAAKCRESASTTTRTFTSADDAAKAFNDIRTCVTDALNTQTGLNVVDHALWITPSGWADQWTTYDRQWWVHLLGVIATAIALILGAPFWFDILKRLTGIRRKTQA